MILLLRLLRQNLEQLHFFISLLRLLQCEYDKKIVCISPLRGLRCNNEKNVSFSVWLLLSLHHDQDRNIQFSFCCYVNYGIIKRKKNNNSALSLLHCDHRKKKHFFIALLPCLRGDHEKENVLIFHLSKTFTRQISPYIYLLHSYVTNLSRKSPSRKNMQMQSFLSQEFQGSLTCFTTQKNIL